MQNGYRASTNPGPGLPPPAVLARIVRVRQADIASATTTGSACAQQVLDGEPLQPGESVALGPGPVDVEVLERAAVLRAAR